MPNAFKKFRYNKYVFFIICLLGVLNHLRADIKSVAISEFNAQGNNNNLSWIGKSCSDALVYRISTDRSVRIVEREFLNKIMGELKLQMGGLVDENTAVEIGRIIGVQYFIIGSATIFNDNIVIATRTINVETGEIIHSNRVSGYLDNIFQLQEDLAKQVSADLALNAVIFDAEGIDYSALSFDIYSKLERLKKMAADLPIFKLDPKRRRRTAEYQLALSLCDDLIAVNPNLYLAHYYKALFSLHAEESGIAEKEIILANKINPPDKKVLLLKAGFYLATKDFSEAEKNFLVITAKYPDDSQGWYGLAKVYMEYSDDYKAIEALINSIAGNTLVPKAVTNLKTLISGSGELTSAKFSHEKYYATAEIFRYYWLPQQKYTDNLNDLARRAIAGFPKLYLPYYMLGYYAYQQKEYGVAEVNYFKCLKLQPTFPEVHRELGLLFLNNKKCLKGKQHIKLYIQTADVVDDYDIIENAIKKCYGNSKRN